MTGRSGIGVALGATMATVTAGYWMTMSPYSQRLGTFPYRATTAVGSPERLVALTFDDGPNEPYTSQIADYLNERDIKATFFQVGQCVLRHPGTSRSLLAAGHLIGNHSNSHRFSRCWTHHDITNELHQSQRAFRDTLSCEPALYRPPWLARTPATFKVLHDAGIRAVSGEFCHALEPMQPSAASIARRALSKVHPGSIVIFHDGYDAKGGARINTVAAVKIVVDALTEQGYTFTTVDRLLGVPAYLKS